MNPKSDEKMLIQADAESNCIERVSIVNAMDLVFIGLAHVETKKATPEQFNSTKMQFRGTSIPRYHKPK